MQDPAARAVAALLIEDMREFVAHPGKFPGQVFTLNCLEARLLLNWLDHRLNKL